MRATFAGHSPSLSANAAAWLLNLVFVFLGVRLALGLRVAYAPPYLDRAAETAVGLWLLFAALVVLLGRWSFMVPGAMELRRRAASWRKRRRSGASASAGAPPSSRTTESFFQESGNTARVGLVVAILGFLGVIAQRGVLLEALIAIVICCALWMALAWYSDREGAGGWRSPIAALTFTTEKPVRELMVTALLVVVLTLATQFLLPSFGLAILLGAVLFAIGRYRQTARPVLVVAVFLLALFLIFGNTAPHSIRFGFVLAAFLMAARAGSLGWSALSQGESGDGRDAEAIGGSARGFLMRCIDGVSSWIERRASLQLVAPLALPLAVLFVHTAFDFGLGLVFYLPMLATVLIAVGLVTRTGLRSAWRRTRTGIALGGGLTILPLLAALLVLFPSYSEEPSTASGIAAEFEGVGLPPVDLLRGLPVVGPSVNRAVVRSLAASDPEFLELALATAGRSEAQATIVQSREQIWGTQAYAASGWLGEGFVTPLPTPTERGVPTVVSYAENTFSAFILREHGAVGGLTVLLLYAALVVGAILWWRSQQRIEGEGDAPQHAARAVVVGGALWIALPAFYVALSNVGAVPLTGQNMPFLGLNGWSDVIISAGIATAMLGALGAGALEEARLGAAGSEKRRG